MNGFITGDVKVRKRTGEMVDFDENKILIAIAKAVKSISENETESSATDARALRVFSDVIECLKAQITEIVPTVFDIEDIQDIIERTMMSLGEFAAAKSFITYRYKRANNRDEKRLMLDIDKTMGGYLKQDDWRVKENSNVNYSIGGLILHNSGAITANFWLKNVYPKEIADAHKTAAMHLHDLSMFGAYCFIGSTRIRCVGGLTPSLEELVSAGITSFKVYSYDTASNTFVEAVATNPRITKYVTELYVVTLSDGTCFVCTSDHQIMKDSEDWVEAQTLVEGDILKSYTETIGSNQAVVKSINIETYNDPIPVYDVTVEGYENFALHAGGVIAHNCAGWSIRQLLTEGLGGVPDKITSFPARHLSTAVQQIVNFLGIMQNEWAGAQAFSSFDTYLAPFIKKDNMTEKEVKQCIQTFLFGVNTPSRWGTQAPFSNITLDWVCPADLADKPVMLGGEEQDFTYGDCQPEMDLFNKWYIEVLIKGDACGRGFQYPIPTYNITKDFDWDSEGAKLLFEMTAKYGTPYFQNFINSDLNPSDVRSMCCRLQLDKRELRKRGGGLFGSDEFTGSIGVVTINLPQIGYLAKTEEDFYNRLDYVMDLAKDSLILKRKTIEKLNDTGLFPYTKRYLSHFNNHFSTIGLCGMNECCLNYLGVNIVDPKGHKFAEEVLDHMRDRLSTYQEETGELFNLEATPAESCLAGDTIIQTYFGDVTIEELTKLPKGLTVPVYSYNSVLGRIELKDAFAYLTNQNARVIEITLDNGQKVICTKNHPFAVRKWYGRLGEQMDWVEAGNLTVGMRLKSNYIITANHGGEETYRICSGTHQPIHIINAEYIYGYIPEGYTVHHKNRKKADNRFENLELMPKTEHNSLHMHENHAMGDTRFMPGYGEDNPFFGKNHTDARKGQCLGDENPARRIDVREKLSVAAKNKTFERHSKFIPGIDDNTIAAMFMGGLTPSKIAKSIGCTYSVVRSRLHRLGLLTKNHVIVGIRELDITIPVYNLEVADNHNFFIGGDNGILVHNTSYRLAKHDKEQFPGIISSGDKDPYYTNSTQLPVDFTEDIFEALDLQESLQRKYTGGTVFHTYLGESISDYRACLNLVKSIAYNYRIPYFSISPTFSICPVHGYLNGEVFECPSCKEAEQAKLRRKLANLKEEYAEVKAGTMV